MGLDEYHRNRPRRPRPMQEQPRPTERTAAMAPFSLPPDHRDCVPLEDVLQLAQQLGPLSAQRVRDWVATRREERERARPLPEWLENKLDRVADAKEKEDRPDGD